MRKALPIAVAFITGMILVISFFTPEQGTAMGTMRAQVLLWGSIISGFTLVLGLVSLWRVNINAVQAKKKDWGFKLITLIAAIIMGVPALLPSSWSPLFGRNTSSIYDWLFTYLSTPMSQTMFAILAFYIASAAYRAFRTRSAEATLLLITACIVMFWRVPMGEAVLRSISDGLPDFINQYIMNGVNLSVQRAILIGASLGATANSLRILLGIERTYMGRG